jgi:hypothetical protein
MNWLGKVNSFSCLVTADAFGTPRDKLQEVRIKSSCPLALTRAALKDRFTIRL